MSEEIAVTNDNRLEVIVQESGLDSTKAQTILNNFRDYFQIAAEWEMKAKSIVVTSASQKAEMQMARTGRLFLREKRIAIEKSRKELKEQALREGKAIDGIANVLKALIVPLEEYLDKQERFVEIKAAEEAARIAAEMEQKAEQERLEKEAAEREAKRIEDERIRKENERLKAEAEEREKKFKAEREAAEAAAKKEREERDRILAEQQAKADAERKVIEEKARKEREAAEAERKVIEAKAQKERAELERKAAELEAENKRKEKEMAALSGNKSPQLSILDSMTSVTCPYCHKTFVPNAEPADA